MVPPFDIFRMNSGYVLWCEAAATVEIAQKRIQELTLSLPGGYLIFNQQTGQPVPVDRFSSQVEYPIAKGISRRDESSSERNDRASPS
jgi:hypothetical protein